MLKQFLWPASVEAAWQARVLAQVIVPDDDPVVTVVTPSVRSLLQGPRPRGEKESARRASIYAANIFGLLRQGAGVCSTEHEDNAALEVIEANLPALVDKTDIGLKRKREETVGSIMALYLGAINARAALQTYKEARAMRGDDDQHYDSVVENNGGTHRD